MAAFGQLFRWKCLSHLLSQELLQALCIHPNACSYCIFTLGNWHLSKRKTRVSSKIATFCPKTKKIKKNDTYCYMSGRMFMVLHIFYDQNILQNSKSSQVLIFQIRTQNGLYLKMTKMQILRFFLGGGGQICGVYFALFSFLQTFFLDIFTSNAQITCTCIIHLMLYTLRTMDLHT